eukprot:4220067-Alexandrium_andersonii.AAC.1
MARGGTMMSPCVMPMSTALCHRQGAKASDENGDCQLPPQHRELDTPAQRAPRRASACMPESAPQPDPRALLQ